MAASCSPFIFLVSLNIIIGKISLLHPLIFKNAKILTAWLSQTAEGKIPPSVDDIRERSPFIPFLQSPFNARNFNDDVSYYYDNLYYPIISNPEAESTQFHNEARVSSKLPSSSKDSSKGYLFYFFYLEIFFI